MFGLRFTNNITYNKALGYFNKHNIDIRPMFYTHEKQDFLKYKIKDKDKIIISHKTDIDLTLFDRTFFVSKENGFSSLNQIKE